MLILKADFCIFGFVYDEVISVNQGGQHKIPIIKATVFAKDNATDLLLQEVTQYVKKLQCDHVYSKNVQLTPKLASTHKLTLITAHSHLKNACVE